MYHSVHLDTVPDPVGAGGVAMVVDAVNRFEMLVKTGRVLGELEAKADVNGVELAVGVHSNADITDEQTGVAEIVTYPDIVGCVGVVSFTENNVVLCLITTVRKDALLPVPTVYVSVLGLVKVVFTVEFAAVIEANAVPTLDDCVVDELSVGDESVPD